MIARAKDEPSPQPPAQPKPQPAEIDVYGLTDQGRVRAANADHFLIASLHHVMRVHAASFGGESLGALETDSRGYLLLVADGVGARAGAGEGGVRAIHAITQYILHMTELFSLMEPTRERDLLETLRASVMHGHEAVLALGDDEGEGTATTLTMMVAYWPRVYIIHAGDSRCYRLRHGVLQRLTKDQNMAQAMIEAGVLSVESAEASRLKHVLWSALGNAELEPQLLATDAERSDVWLLCTDGLTRHVPDERIRERLRAMTSARQVCEDLLRDGLEGGGSDNITIVVGRPVPSEGEAGEAGV
jgi:protein phosphatase